MFINAYINILCFSEHRTRMIIDVLQCVGYSLLWNMENLEQEILKTEKTHIRLWSDGDYFFITQIDHLDPRYPTLMVDETVYDLSSDELIMMVKLGYNPFVETNHAT